MLAQGVVYTHEGRESVRVCVCVCVWFLYSTKQPLQQRLRALFLQHDDACQLAAPATPG